MRTRRCIYCLEDKPESAFKTREHVIPQAFGLFEPENLVLYCVCGDCNQFFGQTIDLKLSRDAMEGLHRFLLNLKPCSQFKSLGRRSTTHAEITEDGPFKGVLCKAAVSTPGGEPWAEPLPQVGFSKTRDGPFRYFTLDQLPGRNEILKFGLETQDIRFMRVFGASLEEAQAQLEAKGYSRGGAVSEIIPEPGFGTFDNVFEISHMEFRAVAKIAFNYLARIEGEGVALMPQFNDVRAYVRWDKHPTSRIVDLARAKPVLRRSTGQPMVCHSLSVQRIGSGIIAQVSLYSMLRYVVTLSPGPFLIDFPLSLGHLFDVETKKISEVPVEPLA